MVPRALHSQQPAELVDHGAVPPILAPMLPPTCMTSPGPSTTHATTSCCSRSPQFDTSQRTEHTAHRTLEQITGSKCCLRSLPPNTISTIVLPLLVWIHYHVNSSTQLTKADTQRTHATTHL